MRYFIIFFCVLCLGLNAQTPKLASTSNTVKKGLSQNELQQAVKMYEAMTKSETYIKMNKSIEMAEEKCNHLSMPLLSKSGNADEYYRVIRKWFEDNLSKTKYKTVEEGINDIKKGADLCNRMLAENKELYALLRRATKEQALAIMEPDRQRAFDKLYETKKKN